VAADKSAAVAALEEAFKEVDEFVWTLRPDANRGEDDDAQEKFKKHARYDGAMRVRYKLLTILQRAKGMTPT
jgi:hypothetical protein